MYEKTQKISCQPNTLYSVELQSALYVPEKELTRAFTFIGSNYLSALLKTVMREAQMYSMFRELLSKSNVEHSLILHFRYCLSTRSDTVYDARFMLASKSSERRWNERYRRWVCLPNDG